MKAENMASVRVESDSLKRLKFHVNIYKGQSLQRPEEFLNDKLIMFKLKINVQDNLGKYTELPDILSSFIDVVRTVDIDFALLEDFFNRVWGRQEVVKFFSSLLDMYKDVSVGTQIGEMLMDYDVFKKFVDYIKMLSFETFNKEV